MIVTNPKNVKSTNVNISMSASLHMEVKEKDMPKVLKSIETKGRKQK